MVMLGIKKLIAFLGLWLKKMLLEILFCPCYLREFYKEKSDLIQMSRDF